MLIWSAASSARIMKNSRPDRTDAPHLILHSGRNMTVSGQLILREFAGFSITGISIKAPAGTQAEWHYAEDMVFNDGFPYPDILSDKTEMWVNAHVSHITWITFRVSPDAVPGTYQVPVTAHTSMGDFTARWVLIIHKAVLPVPAESSIGHEYFFNAAPSSFLDVLPYSDTWWAYMKDIALSLKDMRVNCLHFRLIDMLAEGGSVRTGDNSWSFNFSRVDEFVTFFLKWGSFKYICPECMLIPVHGKQANAIDENGKLVEIDSMTPVCENWIAAYATAVYEHFKEMGWLPMLCMRLEDEPHEKEPWLWLRALIRTYMPGVPCGEPLDTHEVARELGGACDQYIPRLECFEKGLDFYKTRQAAGDMVWVYSCCFPEDSWWMNKFMDQPQAYARMIEWACFSQGVTGFLHWGLNFWEPPMYGICPDARFKGDGFILYPNKEKSTVSPSVRAIATREGMEDWELLLKLQAIDPAAAMAISHRVAENFSHFTYDPTGRLLNEARAEILTLLD